MSRTDQEKIYVSVDGKDYGLFQTFAGGGNAAEDIKNRAGGLEDEESLGGPASREAFTVARLYRLDRDHPIYKVLDAKCGFGRVVAKRVKLSPDGSAFGEPTTYTGTLIKVTPPDHDSNASGRAEFTLEVSADGPIS